MSNKYLEKIASIHINPAHKGLLHKKLGIPEGKPIPESKLQAAKHSGSASLRSEATFAENAKHWNK